MGESKGSRGTRQECDKNRARKVKDTQPAWMDKLLARANMPSEPCQKEEQNGSFVRSEASNAGENPSRLPSQSKYLSSEDTYRWRTHLMMCAVTRVIVLFDLDSLGHLAFFLDYVIIHKMVTKMNSCYIQYWEFS